MTYSQSEHTEHADLVSIIMPSYNTGKYIAESIESVLAQTYKNWELLIVDDCSTDNTDEFVEPYLVDTRIHFFRNEQNSGAAISRNRALREAKGKWIAFLDSDDLWKPEKLEKQVSFMQKNDYHFSYTNYSEIDENGSHTGITVTGPKRISKTGFYNYCWPGCLTVMYDKDVVGLIQIADIRKNNDYAMWLKISQKVDYCYLLNEDLALYRRGRAGSITNHSIKTMISWHYKMYREAERQNVLMATINTMRNMIFGFYKKKRYVCMDGLLFQRLRIEFAEEFLKTLSIQISEILFSEFRYQFYILTMIANYFIKGQEIAYVFLQNEVITSNNFAMEAIA